ncbi:hypothetical protein FVR03_17285 [Pontibacter qinzhouensis]|uniref:Uncharacterized protein n=1 Tax=Pontibacter qinzhouensis TaxID=2603253 RepID=A0A5C8JHT9_9BACT|nr:hypothetical protein [Pontibacter qinzhouensis]TXK36626.1 hypothetical protein FVR03_17285 [Pontibacter qinzhouensis]
MKYKFSTNQFGVDKKGLHLLRSKHKFISYADIDSVTLKSGKVMKNWQLLLLFGICCLLFSAYSLLSRFVFSDLAQTTYTQPEEVIVTAISSFIGAGAIILSLQTKDIMVVRRKGKKVVLLMKPLVDAHKTDDFISFVSQRLGYKKVFVNPDFDKENKATPLPQKTRKV